MFKVLAETSNIPVEQLTILMSNDFFGEFVCPNWRLNWKREVEQGKLTVTVYDLVTGDHITLNIKQEE